MTLGVDSNAIVRAHHLRAYDERYGQAAKAAKDAAAEATRAAETAGAAAGKATDAAGMADTAKANANTAAGEAKSAATKAETAASKADGAATKAETAASTATGAAEKADTAAGKANSMAEKAEASAEKADTATGKANEATIAANNAATKANEVEAKLTGNILKGNVKDTFIHVDDAWPSSLLSIEIEGACKQDGTPSPEAPVPIEVIENPVLKVAGRNLVDVKPYSIAVGAGGSFTPCCIPANTTAYVSFKSSNASNQTNAGGTAFSLYSKDGKQGAHNSAMKSVVAGLNRGTVIANFDAFKHLTVYGYKYPDTAFDVSDYQLEIGGYHDYRPYVGTSLPITLPAEHPYLAKLPDGTADTIEVDKDGNVTLVARVGKSQVQPTIYNVQPAVSGADGTTSRVVIFGNVDGMAHGVSNSGYISRFPNGGSTQNENTVRLGYNDLHVYVYTNDASIIGDGTTSALNAWLAEHPTDVVYPLATPATYPLGKVTVPALPDSISNVWTDAELTPRTAIQYTKDVNIAYDKLANAIAATELAVADIAG